jgi:hypothetical protein
VSLNRKRRIFRPNAGPVPLRGTALPTPGVAIAAVAGAAALLAAMWLIVRPHSAPALSHPTSRIAAPADRLAVLDGDTLMLGDQIVRLAGIAAPARGSACGAQDCGAAAANALAALVRGSGVDCAIKGHDDKGRPEGDCAAGPIPLAQALVRDGWARARAAELRPLEDAARSAARGIWRQAI